MKHVFRVYIAGKMKWLNEEDSEWIASLEHMEGFRPAFSPPGETFELPIRPGVKLILPSRMGFDHSGDLVKDIVETDIMAIDQADALVAVFTEPDQCGTVVELLHAAQAGKPCLAIFVNSLVAIPEASRGLVSKPLDIRGQSKHYWFLVNYLLGFSNVCVAVVADPKEAVCASGHWISRLLRGNLRW